MAWPEVDEGGFETRVVAARDGLRLSGRDYGPRCAARPAVVCLPGLSRGAADFHELATALSTDEFAPCRVLALDYRGRGASEWDRDWRHYDVRVEADDCLTFLTALGVGAAVFVGTSRGGLIAMALSALRPAAIRGVVLNDIGPVIDVTGLIRIRNYLGKVPRPRDFGEALDIVKRIQGPHFPALSEADWVTWARRSFKEDKGRLVPNFDPRLTKPLAALDLEAPFPPLWHLFAGLADVPVLVIRGANSDLLAEATVREMEKRHPGCESHVVAGQGHAPLLTDAESIGRIGRFVRRLEEGAEK